MSGNRKTARLLTGLLFVFQTSLAVGAQTTVCRPQQEHTQGEGLASNSEINNRLFEKQITMAENLRLEAANAGAEWLETEGLLVRSQNQADNDNWDEAFQLVQKACLQAELALRQAEYEEKSWEKRVVN